MKYMGSKNKIAQQLLSIVLPYKDKRTWVEPFVGGANMIDKISGYRIGNDENIYLIALLKAIQTGWIPPTNVSKDFYYKIKSNPENYAMELVAFVAFLCSFGGKWWGGYAFDKGGRNYAQEGHDNLLKQAPNLKDIDFRCGSYLDLEIPTNSLIYCDPPYQDTTKYKSAFNHDEFWQWCRDKTQEGHIVFISEYAAPQDFQCLLTIEHKTSLDIGVRPKRIEKLFQYLV